MVQEYGRVQDRVVTLVPERVVVRHSQVAHSLPPLAVLSRRKWRSREHALHALRAQYGGAGVAALEDVGDETREVVDVGVPPEGRVDDFRSQQVVDIAVFVRRRRRLRVALQTAVGFPLHLLHLHRLRPQLALLVRVGADARVPHAGRHEHVPTHVGVVVVAGRRLDDASEQRVAEVGVSDATSGRERERLPEHVAHDVGALQSAAVLAQLGGDVRHVVLARHVQLVEHRVVQRLDRLVPAALVAQQVLHCNIAQSPVAVRRAVALEEAAVAEHLPTGSGRVSGGGDLN